ncbi:MAG: putative secreted Zn-dependent protease [Limisphaerales bacterium]|jgi:predicted secreted Zn-dependent protease
MNLKWDDFRGAREHNTDVDAVTSCGIKCAPQFTRDNKIRFEIACYFNAHQSWVNHKDANDHLLSHEQGHFDIGEIYARKLRHKLHKHQFKSRNINSQIQEIYDSVFEDYKKAQALYDKQTGHSIDKKGQSIWDSWIDRQLYRYDGYSGRYITSEVKN